jgi:hypothetical protein
MDSDDEDLAELPKELQIKYKAFLEESSDEETNSKVDFEKE